MPVKNRLAELHAEITEWRHDIHQHPEILFDSSAPQQWWLTSCAVLAWMRL